MRTSQVNIFLNSPQNICCGYSFEASQKGTSYEYPKQVFVEKLEKYQYFLVEKVPYQKLWLSLSTSISSPITANLYVFTRSPKKMTCYPKKITCSPKKMTFSYTNDVLL